MEKSFLMEDSFLLKRIKQILEEKNVYYKDKEIRKDLIRPPKEQFLHPKWNTTEVSFEESDIKIAPEFPIYSPETLSKWAEGLFSGTKLAPFYKTSPVLGNNHISTGSLYFKETIATRELTSSLTAEKEYEDKINPEYTEYSNKFVPIVTTVAVHFCPTKKLSTSTHIPKKYQIDEK